MRPAMKNLPQNLQQPTGRNSESPGMFAFLGKLNAAFACFQHWQPDYIGRLPGWALVQNAQILRPYQRSYASVRFLACLTFLLSSSLIYAQYF
jgi:hypothetical protein